LAKAEAAGIILFKIRKQLS